jgi:SAM-dependent methyltransferase
MDRRATAPMRAAMRRLRSLGQERPVPPRAGERLDGWLRLFDDQLSAIDSACHDGGPESFVLFSDLDADLWAMLLTREYEAYTNIRALLPDVPEPSLQELWNGASGVPLARQGLAFYRVLRQRYERHGPGRLEEACVLDFGCGWGRLTRFLARDVAPGCLYGCDPVERILDVCRSSRVPATVARSQFVPEQLPFDERFELAYAFSVFTHTSERAHLACLRALHAALAPGGVLIVTVRPAEYLRLSPTLAAVAADPAALAMESRFLFAAHPAEPSHLQYDGGEMTYGETIVTLPYVRERWSEWFELVGVDVLVEDLYQVAITLVRR